MTTVTGYRLAGGTSLGPIELPAGEQLYAIRGTVNNGVVDVLRLGS